MSAADAAPHPMSRILALPAELRNRIYTYVVASPESLLLYSHWVGVDKQPAVSSVCRQVRNETLGLYYSLNTFQLHIHPNLDVNVFTRWIDAIGPHNARNLQRISIMFHFGIDVSLDIRRAPERDEISSGWLIDLDMKDAEDRLPMHGFWIIRERLRTAVGMPQFGEVQMPLRVMNLVEGVDGVYLVARKPWYQLDEL